MSAGYKHPRQRQQGAIAIFAALGISVMIATLAILDIGFLYTYKRDYQKAADLAAMAGVELLRDSCQEARDRATTSTQFNLDDSDASSITPECGIWEKKREDASSPRFTVDASEDRNALRVTITGSPPSYLIPGERTIQAHAIAMANAPKAALTLRSTLATLSTEESALLDAVVGNMLGGSITLDAVGWNGLLDTEISLLNYLDALAIHAGVEAGNYDELLAVDDLSAGDLLQAAADVLPQDGTADTAAQALGGLLAPSLNLDSTAIGISDLLDIATGTGEEGLDTQLNLFELVMGSAQLANGDQIVDLDLPVQTGIADARVRIATKEPGTIFAAGNPATDKDISVRTANVRALVDLDLEGIGAITGALDALIALLNSNGLLHGLADTLDNALGLDLVGTVESLLDLVWDILRGGNCGHDAWLDCKARDIVYAKFVDPPKLSVAIDLGDGNATVTDFSCGGDPSRTLDVDAHTEAGAVSIGHVVDPDAFLDLTKAPPAIDPVTLVEIGSRTARPQRCGCFLVFCGCDDPEWLQPNGEWLSEDEEADAKETSETTAIASVRLSIDNNPLLGSDAPLYYQNDPDEEDLPEMGNDPEWQEVNTQEIARSVGNTLDQVNVELVTDPEFGGGTISVLAGIVATLLDDIADLLAGPLSAALDPILEALSETLGVQLAQTKIGANLTCDNGGAILVE